MQQDYLLTFHKPDLVDILQDENVSNHFAININFIVLYEHQPKLVVELLEEPEKCLESWDQATINTQLALLKKLDIKCKLKSNVHCRMYHLPGLPDVCRTFFPGNEDAGKFLQVSGTVMTISPVKLLQYQRSYICVKCKYSNLVNAEYDKKYIIKQPKKCSNPEICPGTNFVQINEFDSEYCKDFQQIKIQEHVKKLGVGSMPNTMWVTLEDDLVDRCKPGDDVTICGVFKRRWGEFCKGCKIDIDVVLKANNIQVDSNVTSTSASTKELQETFTTYWNKYSNDPLTGRDLILRSFCPQIFGMYLVKLAIATILAGGCHIEDTNLTGVCTRSEPHLLLVGDPGTGKSQLLRFVSKIMPRSVLTTGVGSTAAGLTVAAVMEHGEWQLEGGALVMSDGGVCCIDEFNSMKEHDRTSIHEAMEQQTISVAKASIVCKLNTRCSILATCNPKGNLNSSNPLCINAALPSPLLSRFDVTLLLRDTVNEQWDEQIADYILNGKSSYSKLTEDKMWSTDILQSYFVIIKKIMPKLSEDAESVLSRYYQMQRQFNSRNKARTTVRLLESLVRLSQGHARLMFHEEVQVVDSIFALVLVDTTMDYDSSILNLNITSRTTFPENPTRNYYNMLENVLNRLQLQDILRREMNRMRENNINAAENVQSRFFHGQFNAADVAEPEDQRTNSAGSEMGQGTSFFEGNGEERRNLPLESPERHLKEFEEPPKRVEEQNKNLNKSQTNLKVQSDKNGRKSTSNDRIIYDSSFASSLKSSEKFSEKNHKENRKNDTPDSISNLLKEFNRVEAQHDSQELNRSKLILNNQKHDEREQETKECSSNDNSSSNSSFSSCTKDVSEKRDREKRKLTTAENTRNFLKKFKKPFVPDEHNSVSKLNGSSSELNAQKLTESDKNQEASTSKVSPKISPKIKDDGDCKENKKQAKGKHKSVKSSSNNFLKDDLEMLKRMPSANDGFNVDLDFDWDNLNDF